ncbi:hypothetical protein C1I99_09650, partial [Micromonospora deserti]
MTGAGSATPRSAAAVTGASGAGAQTPVAPTGAGGATAGVASGTIEAAGVPPRGGPAVRPGGVAVAAQPVPPQIGPPQIGPWPPVAPPAPSLVARRWPGPTAPAHPLLLGAMTAGAIVAASAVPPDRPGLGW